MIFTTVAAEAMRLTSLGFLGIGITVPTSKLHVVGAANITGNMTIGGNLAVTGTTTTSALYFYSGQLDSTSSYSAQQLIHFTGGTPINQGSCYSATSYLFTAPRSGFLCITAGITGSGGSVYAVNGVTSVSTLLLNMSGGQGFGSMVVAVALNDTIGIKTNVAMTVGGFGTCVMQML